jgi:hypothetical protein
MPSDRNAFFRACITNGFIVDANLFLLLAFETSHKRTEGMDEELKITRAVTRYCSDRGGRLILTPHIISEISNLLISRQKRVSFSGNANFTKMTEFLHAAQEHHVPKGLILGNSHLNYLGFTDLSILEAANKEGYGVLTIDNELFCRLNDDSCQVINPKKIAEHKTLYSLLPAA